MSKRFGLLFATMASVAGLAVPAFADSLATDPGRTEYMSNCASCHGVAGKGDGPVRAVLSQAPSDLTTLAKRNGGALPVQLVWEMIDGRSTIGTAAHGSREMPVWGSVYRSMAVAQPDAANQPEWYVRGRILALIDYLQRLQGK